MTILLEARDGKRREANADVVAHYERSGGIRLMVGRDVYERSGTEEDGTPVFRYIQTERAHG